MLYAQCDLGFVLVGLQFGLRDITSRRGNERASFADRAVLHARCAGMVMQDANQRKISARERAVHAVWHVRGTVN